MESQGSEDGRTSEKQGLAENKILRSESALHEQTQAMKKTVALQRIRYSDCFKDGPASIESLQRCLSAYSCKSVLEVVSALSFLRGYASLRSSSPTPSTEGEVSPKRVWRALARATLGSKAVRKAIGDDANTIFRRPVLCWLLARRSGLVPIREPTHATKSISGRLAEC